MSQQAVRSFAAPDSEFKLVRSDTPVDVDGHKLGEPTGEIECVECGRSAGCIDYIPHTPDCPQSNVHSRWWAERHDCSIRP